MSISLPIHRVTERSGFTLIEVLIAILVLALGLLGLGAVFPAVIAQQRNAAAVVEGESVASMVEAIVTDSSEIIDFSDWFDPTPLSPAEHFGEDVNDEVTYEWIVGPLEPYNQYQQRPGYFDDNGDGSFPFEGSFDGFWYTNLDVLEDAPTVAADLNKALSIADRLVPQPYSGKDPKYVWDVVARRMPGTNRPQLGIFIRQIDPRIRVPKGETLSAVLVVGAGTDDPVLPVAIDKNNGRPVVDDGKAANDNFVYAAPQALQVQVVQDHLDWLIFEKADDMMLDTSISFATQPGQKLLDNTGVVRTVLGPPPNNSDDLLLQNNTVRIVRVAPPFQPSQAVVESTSYFEDANDPDRDLEPELDRAQRASWVRQIVFTPRTPLAIRVITLEEDSP